MTAARLAQPALPRLAALAAAVLAPCLTLLPAPPAAAADLARATCGQLMDLSPGDRGQVLLWLHGYYAGAAQRTLLEPDRIAQGTQALQKLCEATPATALIGAEARAALLGDGSSGPSLTTRGPATIPAPQPGTGRAPSPAAAGAPAAPVPAAGALPGAAAPAARAPASTIPRPVREPSQ
jgi:hypothetical protein